MVLYVVCLNMHGPHSSHDDMSATAEMVVCMSKYCMSHVAACRMLLDVTCCCMPHVAACIFAISAAPACFATQAHNPPCCVRVQVVPQRTSNTERYYNALHTVITCGTHANLLRLHFVCPDVMVETEEQRHSKLTGGSRLPGSSNGLATTVLYKSISNVSAQMATTGDDGASSNRSSMPGGDGITAEKALVIAMEMCDRGVSDTTCICHHEDV